jgi:hypothetical protein
VNKGSPTQEQATMSRSVATEQSDFESKMLLVKQKKKQAEHDKRLLVNRIALLKKEERKAYKKIEKTKERAQEVLTVRIEHERHHSEREARHRRNERRRKLEAEANKASEAEARRNRQLAMQHVQQLKFAKVREARSEAAHARDEIRAEQLADVVEKQRKRAEVKEHEAKLRERKQQEMQGILKRNRKAYERKVKEEEKATLLREKEVARMEREEMKLIQKLKKTQVMQQQAFEDLENALNGDLSHLTQVEEPSPVKRSIIREESKEDPEPTPEPAAPEEEQ